MTCTGLGEREEGNEDKNISIASQKSGCKQLFSHAAAAGIIAVLISNVCRCELLLGNEIIVVRERERYVVGQDFGWRRRGYEARRLLAPDL
jgi:hypothetical protein